MKKFRKRGRRRGGRGRKFHRRRGHRGKGTGVKGVRLFQPLALGTSVWPEEYRTVMTTYCSTVTSANTGVTQLSFMGNSFGDGTQAVNGVGPASSGAFPFAKNYPAGLKGMIQTPGAGNTAICPYTQYRIVASKIFVRIVPSPLGGSLAPSSEIRVVVFPSTQLSYAGTTFATLVEQNHAKFQVMSPGYFGTATTTAITGGGAPLAMTPSRFLTNVTSTAKVYGVANNIVHEENAFWCDYGSVAIGSQPVKQYYWQVMVAGDGTGNIAFDSEIIVKHDVVFFNRNYNLSSGQNN